METGLCKDGSYCSGFLEWHADQHKHSSDLLLTTSTMKVLFSENILNSLHICKYARVSTLQQTSERRERSLNKYLMIFSCWLYFICQDVPRAQDNIFKWLLLSDKWFKTLRAGTREELVCHFCFCALIYSISSSLTRMEINCSSLQRLITNISWTPSNLEFALCHAAATESLDLRNVWRSGKGEEAVHLSGWQKVMWHFRVIYSWTCGGRTWSCCGECSR